MKISSLQENLKNGLQTVSHITGKNVNLPILNNIMIQAQEGNIKMIATDLEIGVVCSVRGKIEKEGEFTVDSKIISDYISLLPNKKVDIELKEKNLLIQSDNYKTSIKGQSTEEYPLIPKVDQENSVKVNVEDFKKALSQVVFAVSSSEIRIELSGVLFKFEKDKLIIVATDSYRLGEKSIDIKIENNGIENRNVIVPAKTLQEVIRILSLIKSEDFGEKNKEINFCISDNQIQFNMGNTEIVSRLIEGQYPDYTQIIPTNSETTVLVNRDEFLRAVKAASIFSKTGINDINLDFPSDKNKVVVSSTSSQSGDNTSELDATVNGEDNGIVVNYRYLLDGINAIHDENIKIKITNANTPCVLIGEKDNSYLYIVMPIKQ